MRIKYCIITTTLEICGSVLLLLDHQMTRLFASSYGRSNLPYLKHKISSRKINIIQSVEEKLTNFQAIPSEKLYKLHCSVERSKTLIQIFSK